MEKKKSDFPTLRIADVPTHRKGKHHDLVARIVAQLERLRAGEALSVPLAEFGENKLANVRSAITRATTEAGIKIRTLTDDDRLYVWRQADRKKRA